MIEALKDDNEVVRENAAHALGGIGSEIAVGPLSAIEKNDPDEQARNYAREAIADIKSKKKKWQLGGQTLSIELLS